MKTQQHVSSQIGSIILAASLAYLLQARFMLSESASSLQLVQPSRSFHKINRHSRHPSATAK